MSVRALLQRFLTVRESHDAPDAPEDRLGNPKVKCEQCGKWIARNGLRQHRKDVHGNPNRQRQSLEQAMAEADATDNSFEPLDMGDQ